jgi:hypothetical protein
VTPAELRFWNRAQQRAARFSPEIRAAILRAFQIIRDSLSERELAAIIQSGNLDRLFAEVLSDQVLDRAFIPVRDRIRNATATGFRYTVADLPRGGIVDGTLAVSFNYLNPRVITAIRGLDSTVMDRLTHDVRETVRAFVEQGIRDGVNPRTIARDLRDVIGLGPTQLQEVQNYRDALMGLNGRRVADYTLRDLRMNPRTPEQIEKAVAAYQKRRVALNAETTARTAALDAMKLGQQLSWADAVEKGVVNGDQLKKRWRGVMDDRERDSHIAMEGDVAAWDQPYSNGQMTPGENEWNCRCLSMFFVARG